MLDKVRDGLFNASILSKNLKHGGEWYNPISLVNKGQRWVMENMSLQSPNFFEILLYPKDSFNNPNDPFFTTKKAQALLDTAIGRFHIQRISLPQTKINYDKKSSFTEKDSFVLGSRNINSSYYYSNNRDVSSRYSKGGAVGVESSSKVSIVFVENEFNVVLRYLNYWQNTIYDKKTGRFADNMESSKKNAKVLLRTGEGIPTGVWFQINGMQIEGIQEVTLGHEEDFPLKIQADFFIEDIYVYDVVLENMDIGATLASETEMNF